MAASATFHTEYLPLHALPVMPPLHLGDTMLMPTVQAPSRLPPILEYPTNNFIERPPIQHFRDTLTSLNVQEAARFSGYIQACTERALSRHAQITRGASSEPWNIRVARQADDDELHSILTQHNRVVSEVNHDPVIGQIVDGRRAWVADRVAEGVSRQWLHPHMARAAQVLRQKVTTWFGDDLRDGLLRSGADAYHVTHPSKPNYVILKQHLDIADPKERAVAIIRTIYGNQLSHEFLHAARVGNWLPSWLGEVAVEDVNQMLIHGGNSRVALGHRPGVGYPNRREIRETLLKSGSLVIDDLDYMQAISSEGAESAAYRHLIRQLDRSWGVVGVMGHVSRRLGTLERKYILEASATSGTPDMARARAAFELNRELREEPETIFGHAQKTSQRFVGTAALAHSTRS